MNRCKGFDVDMSSAADDGFALPCRPSTVVYGHAASRDLDVKRWTTGLDTGCLYGRKLTLLVLQRKVDDGSSDEDKVEDEPWHDEDNNNHTPSRIWGAFSGTVRRREHQKEEFKPWIKRIRFGDDALQMKASLVSVECPKPGDLV